MAVADVRGVRVALLVGVRVVLAVVGDPVEHRALQRDRAGDRERVLRAGLEVWNAAVGQQPVVADGDAEAADHVADGEDRQVGHVDGLVPQQDDGGEQPQRTGRRRR